MSESTSQASCDAAAYAVEYLGAPGVWLVPTDEDLIVHYLERKLRGEPPPHRLHLSALIFVFFSLSLAVAKLGQGAAVEGAWYLFSPRERKFAGAMQPKRETDDGVGYWKAIGKEKLILGGADGMVVVGTKRALSYYEHIYEEDAEGSRRTVWNKYKPTLWRMDEFVASNTNRPVGDDTASDPMLVGVIRSSPIINHGGSEEEPTSYGDGESQEKHRTEQQLPGDDGSNWFDDITMRSNLDFDDHIGTAYVGGGEILDAQAQQPVGGSSWFNTTMPSCFFDFDDHIGTGMVYAGYTGAQGEQPPAGSVSTGTQGDQQPATAGAAPLDGFGQFVGLEGSIWFDTITPSIFNSGDHIDTGTANGSGGGGETLDAQRAWHKQAESSGGGAGSSLVELPQATTPDEQQQPTPEAPNEEGAVTTSAASEHAVS
ncbi:hypothetical protein HU200_025907 [Digitaria exilis]|uniref:NAC domain-containing protein n=1 Tax=Digitaria exilis TaxID=1010633 RepID=A0A835EUN6_9POAL|nr:hypothetical protein HU200_025907 [Digitaria exilis]